MGCLLKYIYKKIYEMDADAFVDILNGLRHVISQLLVLNVADRPSANQALLFYQDFLINIAPKSVKKSSGGTRKVKGRKTYIRRTYKSHKSRR